MHKTGAFIADKMNRTEERLARLDSGLDAMNRELDQLSYTLNEMMRVLQNLSQQPSEPVNPKIPAEL